MNFVNIIKLINDYDNAAGSNANEELKKKR